MSVDTQVNVLDEFKLNMLSTLQSHIVSVDTQVNMLDEITAQFKAVKKSMA